MWFQHHLISLPIGIAQVTTQQLKNIRCLKKEEPLISIVLRLTEALSLFKQTIYFSQTLNKAKIMRAKI